MRRIAALTLALMACLCLSCSFRIGTGITGLGPGVRWADSATRFGITWSFSRSRPAGSFANGDPWVLGPVDIVAISPGPALSGDRVVNGSMLNPQVAPVQGYDSMMMGRSDSAYEARLNAALPGGQPLSPSNPLRITLPASLLSAESDLYPEGENCWVKTIAVLTVLDALPPEGAFRPCYAGTAKTVLHRAADLDLGRLPALAPPMGAAIPAIAEVSSKLEKTWIEHFPGWVKELMSPTENMPNYGREIAGIVSEAALLLCLEGKAEAKEELAIRLVQVGLDNGGLALLPGGAQNWAANGGHMTGRAFPIVLAAALLGDQALAAVMEKTGAYAYSGGYHEGALPPDYLHFGEIDQTFFVSQRDIDRMASGPTPGLWEPDARSEAIPYAAADLGRADWGIRHAAEPDGDNANPASIYRHVVTPSCSGFVLASLILGIRALWNHEPLFEYLDAWMSEDPFYPDSEGLSAFMTAMWAEYRGDY